jgi:hypothetical protein
MNYQKWFDSVPAAINEDVVWKITAYRYALFIGELAWVDCENLNKHPLARNNSSKLIPERRNSYKVRESEDIYETSSSGSEVEENQDVLNNVPMPE